MKLRTLLPSFLTVTVAGAALAAPTAPAPAKPNASKPAPSGDSFHITMRAGKGRLGVAVIQISPELRAYFGAPADRGVLVDGVKPDSPAARAGVQVGDVIVEVDGDAAQSAGDMLAALDDRKKGETVTIVAMRAGRQEQLSIKLEDDPGLTWQRSGSPIDSSMRMPFQMDWPEWFDQDLRKQFEELERRLDQLERSRPSKSTGPLRGGVRT